MAPQVRTISAASGSFQMLNSAAAVELRSVWPVSYTHLFPAGGGGPAGAGPPFFAPSAKLCYTERNDRSPPGGGEEPTVIKWFKKLPNTTKMLMMSGVVALLAILLVTVTVLQNA